MYVMVESYVCKIPSHVCNVPLCYINHGYVLSVFLLPLTQSVSKSVISGTPKSALSTASTPNMNCSSDFRPLLPSCRLTE